MLAGYSYSHAHDKLKESYPEYTSSSLTLEKLEKHYRDMQDIEFNGRKGTLYMLQTRNGKPLRAALKSLFDMVNEGL